jgi:DNA-binding beta-propeller fold protein YncE
MLRLLMVSILAVAPILAQDADSDRLRALTKAAPQLAVDRIELKVNPAMTLEGISAVAGDQKGNIYVIHRPASGDPVVVVDQKGSLIRSWGKGMFKTPHGIRVDPAGNVWTVDAHTSMVYKFTPEGKTLLEISVGDVPDPSRDFCGATDVAFARNGHVYVSDGYCNGRVLEYDADGKKVRQWGKRGTGPGEFNLAHAIAISPQGNVYVADRGNGRLQWFDPQGKFLGEFKYGGELYNVTFDQAGDLYVSTHVKGVPLDTEFNMVKIDPVSGTMLGRFEVRSHQLSAAPDGTLLPGTRSGDLLLFRPRK